MISSPVDGSDMPPPMTLREWYSPRFMKRSPGVSRLPQWVRAAWLPGALLLASLIAVAFRARESARCADTRRQAEPIWLVVAAVLQLGTYFCTAVILKLGLRRSGTRVRMRSLVPLGLVKLFI